MSTNRFNHIDLRVADMEAARRFYSRLLPALGFTRDDSGQTWGVFRGDGAHPNLPYFGFTEERGHRANSNRIAFWAASREEVDRIAAIAQAAGARSVEGPKPCPQYSSTYYAVFFEDPSGNRLEVCFREN